MDVNIITPFLESVKSVLEQFGITGIKVESIKKDKKYSDLDIMSIIGVVGDARGNVVYSMTETTAKKVVSSMMMGMPVESMDEIAMSAVGELTNMFTGNASTLLSQKGFNIDITPPSTIIGKEMHFNTSRLNFLSVSLETSVGRIDVNVGLEK